MLFGKVNLSIVYSDCINNITRSFINHGLYKLFFECYLPMPNPSPALKAL